MTALRAPLRYATVPRLWDGETAVCVATGPSLTPADVEACRGRAKVIAIKDAIDLAPFADVLYGCGADSGQWWPRNGDRLASFLGLRFTLDPVAARWAQVLKVGPETGLSHDPTTICHGRNSGYQALNLAVLLGATRILLLGYDMQPGPRGESHVHGDHPWRAQLPFDAFLRDFASIVTPLAAAGVQVINCTRRTALTVFPQLTIEEALS